MLFSRKSAREKSALWAAIGLLTGPIGVLILFYLTSTTPANAEESFKDRVEFFQGLGILRNKRNDLIKKTVNKISKAYREDWETEFNNNDPLADLMLLKYSDAKVWWEDTEADVLPGNAVYENTITEWANISNGVLSPRNIKETWESDTGPITITFELQEQEKSIQPEYLDDYIDTKILLQINKLIKNSSKQFEMYEPFDQTAFVICLTNSEKRALKKRGWQFAW